MLQILNTYFAKIDLWMAKGMVTQDHHLIQNGSLK